MVVLLRLIAILAAFAFAATVVIILWWFGPAGMLALLASGVFGIVTILSWIVTLVAGPIAAVRLLQLRPSGRVAAVVLFLSVLLYSVAALNAFRTAQMARGPITVVSIAVAALVIVLLSPAAQRACVPPSPRSPYDAA